MSFKKEKKKGKEFLFFFVFEDLVNKKEKRKRMIKIVREGKRERDRRTVVWFVFEC